MKIIEYSKEKKYVDAYLSGRKGGSSSVSRKADKVVTDICRRVESYGDRALLDYTRKFDLVSYRSAKSMIVKKQDIRKAYRDVDKRFLSALRKAKKNIVDFHKMQVERTKSGKIRGKGYRLEELLVPFEAVGLYVPGGRAPLFSSVLMNGIPAILAKVNRKVLVTPPDRKGKVNPHILVACAEVGIDEIYKVGGAQAIAALAYGTKTIPKVEKVVGPGNVYVTSAKKILSRRGQISIDFEAGPSEILVVADKSAKAKNVAADLIAQAEHDISAISILVTDSKRLANEVNGQIDYQSWILSRREIVASSLNRNGLIILVKSIGEAVELANLFAPEHLSLQVKNTKKWLAKIKSAGAVFVGDYSPVALGDYFAGPNHVLPTGGSARYYSPLSVDDFYRRTNVISYSREKLKISRSAVIKLATVEGMDAHANSVKIRFKRR